MKARTLILCLMAAVSCSSAKEPVLEMTVLNPGHFHASLLQKNRLQFVSDTVRVYAPEGEELQAYLDAVEAYNSRCDSPTAWKMELHVRDNFLDALPEAGKGCFVVLAGNNRCKAEYIARCVELGYNVLSDKPMAITAEDFDQLRKAYSLAQSKNLVIYDMMTERYEILNRIVRTLIPMEDVFGKVDGAIEIEDVHYFCKMVSGKPLIRPQWYFDVEQQGYGIADVTTHFIDIVFWECFPDLPITPSDLVLRKAEMYPTVITREQFRAVTGAAEYPDYLKKYLRNGKLEVLSNGKIDFEVKGQPVIINVRWDYAPEDGEADSFFQKIPGTVSSIEIVQDATSGYSRELRLRIPSGELADKVGKRLADDFPNVKLKAVGDYYLVEVPQEARLPHEEHFNKVGQAFTEYVRNGGMPDWENSNTLSKYYLTTKSVEAAK